MIARIARKEFLEMTRDGRFRTAFVVILGLLFISLTLGWVHYREVEAQHRRAQEDTRRQWLEQGTKNPHGAAHYGVYAFKPKTPLSLFDRGVDAYTGVAVWLEAHKRNEFKHRPARDATAIARFGELGAATVLQLLVPLLIIALTFTAFAGERDLGTLRQVMSLGVRPRDLAIGKALGISLALAALLVPASLAGAAAIGQAAGGEGFSTQLPAIALLTVGYMLYFGCFVALSLAVSAIASGARTALLILLGIWILNCLIIPRAATDVAERVYPTPAALEFARIVEAEMRKGPNSHDPTNSALLELKSRVLAQYGVTREEDLPVSFAGIALQEAEEYGYEVFDEKYAELETVFEKQDDVQTTASAVAPLLALRSLSMAASGTDPARHRHFAKAAEDYRRTFIKIMNDDVTENAVGKDFGYMAGPQLWAEVPDFVYNPPAFGRIAANHARDLVALAAWFTVASVAAVAAIARVRVS